MATEDTESPQKPSKGYGYGKMSKRQWILIYVVVGVVVYALIYYFFIHKSGGSTTSSGYSY